MLVSGLLPAGSLSVLRCCLALLGDEQRARYGLYATTTVYRRGAEPYNVALVDLDEGFRMMRRVEGMPAEEVEVGMKETFAVRTRDDGPVAVFEPEKVP